MTADEELQDPEGGIVAVISKEYIQGFMQDNYDFKLSNDELNELKQLIWEQEYDLMRWIDEAVRELLEQGRNKKGESN